MLISILSILWPLYQSICLSCFFFNNRGTILRIQWLKKGSGGLHNQTINHREHTEADHLISHPVGNCVLYVSLSESNSGWVRRLIGSTTGAEGVWMRCISPSDSMKKPQWREGRANVHSVQQDETKSPLHALLSPLGHEGRDPQHTAVQALQPLQETLAPLLTDKILEGSLHHRRVHGHQIRPISHIPRVVLNWRQVTPSKKTGPITDLQTLTVYSTLHSFQLMAAVVMEKKGRQQQKWCVWQGSVEQDLFERLVTLIFLAPVPWFLKNVSPTFCFFHLNESNHSLQSSSEAGWCVMCHGSEPRHESQSIPDSAEGNH